MFKLRFYKLTGPNKGNTDHEETYSNINDMFAAYYEAVKDTPKFQALEPTMWIFQDVLNVYYRLAWCDIYNGTAVNDLYGAFVNALEAAEAAEAAEAEKARAHNFIAIHQNLVIDEPIIQHITAVSIEEADAIAMEFYNNSACIEKCNYKLYIDTEPFDAAGVDITASLPDLDKYEKIIRAFVGRCGGYREREILSSPHTYEFGGTWNNEHKIIDVLERDAGPGGYRGGFSFDLVTKTVCG